MKKEKMKFKKKEDKSDSQEGAGKNKREGLSKRH